MNKIRLSVAVLLSLLAVSSCIALVGAVKPPEYDITNEYHGIDCPIGADVHVVASTTDLSVYQVTFRWHDLTRPNVWQDAVTTYTTSTDGKTRTFTAPVHAPDTTGNWGVQGFFQGPDGTTQAQVEDVVQIKATSFFVVPESALGALAAMGAGVAAFSVIKLKHKN